MRFGGLPNITPQHRVITINKTTILSNFGRQVIFLNGTMTNPHRDTPRAKKVHSLLFSVYVIIGPIVIEMNPMIEK